jgi:GNAT superfamily N-acetyltransferase
MIYQLNNNQSVLFRALVDSDLQALAFYLTNLSPETRKKFAPHSFETNEIHDFYAGNYNYLGFGAWDQYSENLVAYVVVRIGYSEPDRNRLEGYGLKLNRATDALIAPSVADNWQGIGLGVKLFDFVCHRVRSRGVTRIFLWGGVQAGNQRAIAYYRKIGFLPLGTFFHQGENIDMVYPVS